MTWGNLQSGDPWLAEYGLSRLNGQICYLATGRRDGRPRLHTVYPVVGDGHLSLFMEPTSAIGYDLARGSSYILHSLVSDPPQLSGEFLCVGEGRVIEDKLLRELAESHARFRPQLKDALLELSVDKAVSTTYQQGEPQRREWGQKS
jgi:hypothetical protein